MTDPIPYHIGFTGTQEGMTDAQYQKVWGIIWQVRIDLDASGSPREVWGHHGDCVGADADFHRIVRRQDAHIWLHPPLESRLRAFCDFDRTAEPRPYLDRNHDIVDACEVLIATPRSEGETLRSGTWATVRYADKHGVNTVVVNPDGTINPDWGNV